MLVLKGLSQVAQATAGPHFLLCLAICARGIQSGWGHSAKNRGQKHGERLRCAMGTRLRGKKSSRISERIGSRYKPVMFRHSWRKKNKFILVWAKKKAVSKLFQLNCFLMKQLL